jgi:DNA-binding transcriptional regulator YdaS (Cro superfamily)
MQDICPSTAKNDHIYLRVLHDACKALGGEHKLALHLGVSVEEVEAWLMGKAMPPDQVFLACLDIVQVPPRRT